ncbi:large ribosomal subunit protein uL29m-like [Physella acuta]|uniref:large ribosomal subunit protein uL29m-like n=1 Tax=Physella acuta TaxID=109671 RepID=UPI0027DCE616|nr:large ribosomal subunit protein uL29m-like [Physella acuta]
MAALRQCLFRIAVQNSISKHKIIPQTCSLIKQFSSLRLSPATPSVLANHKLQALCPVHSSTSIHTSPPAQDLMEFFDRKDVWGETSVLSGRPYRLDELRLKSNQDIHKLWYVLLKERNMLLTMQEEYHRNVELFPNPERITKVEESMENILEVVKERDNAVSLLETGKPAGPGGAYVRDFLGRVVWRNFKEYGIPPHMNKVYRLLYPRGFNRVHLRFLPLWREKVAKQHWYRYNQRMRMYKKLEEKFPHLKGKLQAQKPEEPKIN